MRNQLISIGLPPVILELPRHQLRRLVIDGFYQSLIVLTSAPNTSMAQNNYPTGIVYATDGFVQHQGLVHPSMTPAPNVPGSFNPNHGLGQAHTQFGGGSFIPQQYVTLQHNNNFAFTASAHGISQVHDYTNMSGYVSQPGFNKPNYEGFAYNSGMSSNSASNSAPSACTPNTHGNYLKKEAVLT